MAISKVRDIGSTQNLTSEGATIVTLTATPTTGNWLIARIAVDNSGGGGAAPGLSVSGSAGNAWTVLGPANQDPGTASSGMTCYMTYAQIINPLVTGDQISFDWTGSPAAKAIVVEEWIGIDDVTPVVVSPVTSVGATTPVTIAITPTAAGQLVYMCLAIEGNTGDTYTVDTDTTNGSWVTLTSLGTTSGTATNNATVRGQYKVVTASGAQNWSVAITARDRAAFGVVFGVGAPPVPHPVSDPVNISLTESAAIQKTKEKPVSDPVNISVVESVTVTKATAETLNPDAALTQTNLTGAVTDIDEDPDSPDASWMTGGGAVVLRVSFPTPSNDLAPGFPQEFRIRARPGT